MTRSLRVFKRRSFSCSTNEVIEVRVRANQARAFCFMLSVKMGESSSTF